MKRYNILIIGGGAAGLAAAVSARKENNEAVIGIVERNDRVGKKILATGNGRCNFTNMNITPGAFFGESEFIKTVIEGFSSYDAIEFFKNLGVMHREEEGRVYPLSNQATAILDALRLYLNENSVDFITDTFVSDVKFEGEVFKAGNLCADKLIVATGGKASPNTGSDGSGYKILEGFGHKLTETKPALVSLKTDTALTKGLKGVKVFGKVTLKDKGKFVAEDEGEILFTDYGISGIPVMQISRFARKGMEVFIDMLPGIKYKDVLGEIYERVFLFPEREAGEIFSGMVNKKIAVPLLKYAKIEKTSVKAKNFTEENILKCGEFLKSLKLVVFGDNGFNNAQVCAGGVKTDDFSPFTMESKLQKGLYAAGEIMDCDGLCGGFNLHWAWATGVIAGKDSACGNAEYRVQNAK